MNITANINKFIFTIAILVLWSCNKDDNNSNNCFPRSTINVSLNLNLASYQALQYTSGWIYYNGSLSGTRGLIIVNTGNGFMAYDRNAPHICPTQNTTLEVEDDLLIVCPEDGAKWILSTGQPAEIANRAPVSYFTYLNGSELSITN